MTLEKFLIKNSIQYKSVVTGGKVSFYFEPTAEQRLEILEKFGVDCTLKSSVRKEYITDSFHQDQTSSLSIASL